MSRTSLTSPVFFGMAMSGDNHGVAPSTFSMMPSSRISRNFSFTFFLMLCGIRLDDCATGGMDSSISSLTSTPFKLPVPLKSFSCCLSNFAITGSSCCAMLFMFNVISPNAVDDSQPRIHWDFAVVT